MAAIIPAIAFPYSFERPDSGTDRSRDIEHPLNFSAGCTPLPMPYLVEHPSDLAGIQ
jgi:hypothetical protein